MIYKVNVRQVLVGTQYVQADSPEQAQDMAESLEDFAEQVDSNSYEVEESTDHTDNTSVCYLNSNEKLYGEYSDYDFKSASDL